MNKVLFSPSERILIYGIGNLGRQDDGLGIRLIQNLEELDLPASVTLEANYQLNIEDALLMASFDVVLFVDASVTAQDEEVAEPAVSVRSVEPCPQMSFSTHAVSFGEVLHLCESLYHKKPRTYLLALRGYEWEVNEELSEKAKIHLEEAFRWVCEQLGVLPCTKSP